MEGTRHGEAAVYGHAPPLDARGRKQRQKGEPPQAGESAAPATRSTPDTHTHGVGVAAGSMLARGHYRRSSARVTGALSGTGLATPPSTPAIIDPRGRYLHDRQRQPIVLPPPRSLANHATLFVRWIEKLSHKGDVCVPNDTPETLRQ